MKDDCLILIGDALKVLKEIADETVQCCVTSPPYFDLRDYKVEGQIGSEKTLREYIHRIVLVCREIKRVLRKDGTFWLNLGDCYSQSGRGGGGKDAYREEEISKNSKDSRQVEEGKKMAPKNVMGVPWKVAFALQDEGWNLRTDIVWNKPNAMPESVMDRPSRAHEYIFFFSKSQRYYYDADSIRTPISESTMKEIAKGYNGQARKDFFGNSVQNASEVKSRIINGFKKRVEKQRGHGRRHAGFNERWDQMTRTEQMALGANKRTVWTVPTSQYFGDHFATFPPELIRPCILAGSRPGDIVLDPLAGSGTTGEVCLSLGRKVILIELNPDSIHLIKERISRPVGFPI